MITPLLDETFAVTLRNELVAEARRSRPRRRAIAAALAGMLAVSGGAFAITAANGGPDADLPLAAPLVETHVGNATVALPPAPADARWLMVIVGTTVGAGTLTTPSGESGLAHVEAYPLTREAAAETQQQHWPFDPRNGLTVSTSNPDTIWRIYTAYTTSRNSDWGVVGDRHYGLPRISTMEQSAQTRGIEGLDIPTLLAVHTKGGQVGYVNSELLFGFDPLTGWQSRFKGAGLSVLSDDGGTAIGRISVD